MLFSEEHPDCLRVLIREVQALLFEDAMRWIHEWTAAFDYEDLDEVIADIQACGAFERSLWWHRPRVPGELNQCAWPGLQ